MPSTQRNSHDLRPAITNRISLAAAPPVPSVEAQCQAVVARLEQITASDIEHDDEGQGTIIDVRALESLPDPTGWGGRAIVPWGHPHAGGMLSQDIKPVRAGRTGSYLQYSGGLYDTVRDAFVAARLNKPVSAPWTTTRQVHGCGCLTVATARNVAIEGTIDVEGQLELMRQVLKHVALAGPEIDLILLADDLFGGQKVLAEHYLWQLEVDGFVDHAHDERQTSLMPTAEGCSVLLMLELTKPTANDDVMSPEALAEVAQMDAPPTTEMQIRAWQEDMQLDVPRFLNNRQPRDLTGPTSGLSSPPQNTRRGPQSGRV